MSADMDAADGRPRSGVGGQTRSSAMRGKVRRAVDCDAAAPHMRRATRSGVHSVVAVAVVAVVVPIAAIVN